MSNAIILKLENDYVSGMKCSQLLKETLRVATLLKDEKMVDFCQREIKGFKDNPKNFPEYRYGHFNYYVEIGNNIRCPLQVPEKLKNIFNIFYETLAIKQPISELEDRLKENFPEYQIQITPSLKQKIRNALTLPDDCNLIPYFSKSNFEDFIEKIRTIIGKWIANVKSGIKEDIDKIISYEQVKGNNIVGQSQSTNISVEKIFTTDFDQYKEVIESSLTDTNITAAKQQEVLSLFTKLKNAVTENRINERLEFCNLIKAILVGTASDYLTDGLKFFFNFLSAIFESLLLQ